MSALHQTGGSTIDGATYTVDAVGNRTAKTDNRANVTSNYTYDAIYELSGRSYEEMRVIVLDFLDTDVFTVSIENCVSFLDPLIESWDINLATFGVEIVLNRRLVPGHPTKFEFVESEPDQSPEEEPGLKEFLRDVSLSGSATPDEIEFLKKLRFKEKRPTPLYYYREWQNLRDPVHFRTQ